MPYGDNCSHRRNLFSRSPNQLARVVGDDPVQSVLISNSGRSLRTSC